MIEKTLSGMFKVIADEAAANPAFGKRLEEQVAKFGQDLAERRMAEKAVGDFHPVIELRKHGREALEARLSKFDATALRVIIEKHHLDPAATLKGKAARKTLAAHILAAAAKRAERDAKLFEY